jgi:hypothetical protein
MLVRVPDRKMLTTYTRERPVYLEVALDIGRPVAYITLFHFQ